MKQTMGRLLGLLMVAHPLCAGAAGILLKTNDQFKFHFVHDGMSRDIPGGDGANKVRLEQYPKNTNAWQDFLLERAN